MTMNYGQVKVSIGNAGTRIVRVCTSTVDGITIMERVYQRADAAKIDASYIRGIVKRGSHPQVALDALGGFRYMKG